MLDSHTAFVKKTEILCKGLYLDENLIEHYKNQGIEISYGRKGGAGPLGGRYFLLENGTIVNAVLWNTPQKTNLVIKENTKGYFGIFDMENRIEHSKLRLVKNPRYYSPEYKTSDGIEMKKIALVHGIDCLSSTIYQKCVYQGCNEGCKFCGIELSLESGATIEEKNAKQMCEVIAAAKEEGRCNHMTLTSGTDKTKDKGAKRYIELLKGIKQSYPKLPLHVQIEPLDDLTYIDELKDAGADTIGIHLEVLDQNIRNTVTPGKSRITFETYKKNWSHALEIFGNNQVSSYLLTGFGESPDEFILGAEKVISIGVIPYITPVRSIPGVKDLPVSDPNSLIEIYRRAAFTMKEYGINPLKSKAGCVRCGGCSAIKEAFIDITN
ncbi:MAG: radical SAM protein [Candidatus Lokiarchaeota archaeon]|nr:radical SAM protein [Candidatus Lokiarchaeota archaeon]